MGALNTVILYFYVFAFLGWLCESVYCALFINRKWVNRGFLFGPFCPIYGFGGLLVVYLLAPFTGDPVKIFLLGMLSTTLLEYITSVVMEKLFKTRWWDYSKQPFNINGRVCLLNTLEFGMLSLVAVYWIYPPLAYVVERIHGVLRGFLAWGMAALFLVDVTLSVRSALALNNKLAELQAIADEIREKMELQKKRIEEKLEGITDAEEFKERIDALRKRAKTLQARNRASKRLLEAFPNLRSNRYQQQLEELRRHLEARLKKKNKQEEAEE